MTIFIRTSQGEDGLWYAVIKAGTKEVGPIQGYSETSAIDQALKQLDAPKSLAEKGDTHEEHPIRRSHRGTAPRNLLAKPRR